MNSFYAVNTLAHYTSPALIAPQAHSKTPADQIAELGDKLYREGKLPDLEAFLGAVLAREALSPTSCSPGWALPHARLLGLPQLSFALARTSVRLAWLGPQPSHVALVWLFAVPETETKAYLNLVAAVAKLSQNAPLLNQLMNASDALAMHAVLAQVPVRGVKPLQLAAPVV